MDIEIGKILQLSNNMEYIIISKANYNNRQYLCLMNENNTNELKFAYVEDDKIVFVKKEYIDIELYNKLYEEAKKEIY